MKAKNNIPAAILTGPGQDKTWTVKIKLPRNQWAEMIFSQREVAVSEFNRIKIQGIFGNQWLEGIEINETQ